MELVFATNNTHKIREIAAVLPEGLYLKTLSEAGIETDIPEPFDTLEENARTKAITIFERTGENSFGEDTGLEVAALNGAPGVKSARYAGEERNFSNNVAKLLEALQGRADRSARFRTVICLVWQGKEHLFEGMCKGHITEQPSGNAGFGYDPVFIPEGATVTFADMSTAEKNHFSHRRKAFDKLVIFLNQLPKPR